MKYIIYKITIADHIYIGSTKDFKQRKKSHKSACKTKELKVYQLIREAGGWDKCEMIPIEEYECEEQLQARIREEHWRREYNANMNSFRAHITEEERIENKREGNKEWCKQNYKENKETINEKQRQYYHATIEKQRERKQIYREATKERDHTKYNCECGGKYTHTHIRKHEKSKKHLDYLERQNLTI